MDVIQQFEEYLVENGIAPKTIESYVGSEDLDFSLAPGCHLDPVFAQRDDLFSGQLAID